MFGGRTRYSPLFRRREVDVVFLAGFKSVTGCRICDRQTDCSGRRCIPERFVFLAAGMNRIEVHDAIGINAMAFEFAAHRFYFDHHLMNKLRGPRATLTADGNPQIAACAAVRRLRSVSLPASTLLACLLSMIVAHNTFTREMHTSSGNRRRSFPPQQKKSHRGCVALKYRRLRCHLYTAASAVHMIEAFMPRGVLCSISR